MEILKTKSRYFDDVNLIASTQEHIESRKDVPNEKWRIMVSPMPSIVGPKFAEKALELGLTVCTHRFSGIEEQLKILGDNYDAAERIFCSIGLGDYKQAHQLQDQGCENIIIDVANGYLKSVYEFARQIRHQELFKKVMVGNVHSSEGVFNYYDCLLPGKVLVRVGIGGGAMCSTTRSATGFGRGPITAIQECSAEISKEFYKDNFEIIADGGIRHAADASKAFGAGADYIMLGSYFANCFEAQNVVAGEFKHWGCASDYNQQKYGVKRRHAEGIEIDIPLSETTSLTHLVDELWGGISSAVSYSGNKSLGEFIGNGKFELKYS